jgi:signal transduction histidine kinase
MFRTARWRLVGWNVLVLSIILTVLCGVVYYVFRSHMYTTVDDHLRTQQGSITETLVRTGDWYSLYSLRSGPFDTATYRIVIADSAGAVDMTNDCPPSTPFTPPACRVQQAMLPTSSASLTSVLSSLRSGVLGDDLRTVTFRNEPWRVLTFPVLEGGQVLGIAQVGRSVVGEEDSLHALGFWLLLGLLVSIGLTGAGSLFLAHRALIPIRQAFSRQRQFTADASHELRTPLALIRANAEMLSLHGDRLPEGDGELVSEIIQETDHLNRLVSDLLTLARADAETAQIATRPVDFRELVADVHEDLHLIAASRGIDSAVTVNGPVVVAGDEVRLRQLLLILLDNALKYTDPGGKVDMSLRREDNHARLVVADTGIGIPSKDLPHIFDRFYRVDRAREHESGGTGLGLAIARWIVQAHHGSIKVDSEVGRGTRFQIDLPVTASSSS